MTIKAGDTVLVPKGDGGYQYATVQVYLSVSGYVRVEIASGGKWVGQIDKVRLVETAAKKKPPLAETGRMQHRKAG